MLLSTDIVNTHIDRKVLTAQVDNVLNHCSNPFHHILNRIETL